MNSLVSPLELFRAKGVPNRRVEEWKYTDVRAMADAASIESIGAAKIIVDAPAPIETIEQDGGVPAELIHRLSGLKSWSSMEIAAHAFSRGPLVLRVPAHTQVDRPLSVEISGSGHAWIILLVEAHASVTLAENVRQRVEGLQNVALSIVLETGARLTHVRQVPYEPAFALIETASVIQEKASLYRMHLMQGGGKLSRAEWNILLNGEAAVAELSGASVLGGKVHGDVTTRIEHAARDTASRQLFKKVAGGRSRAVYQGKIVVKEGAIGSDSRQTVKALLLSRKAEADLKPELEILADDVKCAHGAAVGDLDEDSLFYLRARGIPEHEARAMLVAAFLQEVVDLIEDEHVRNEAKSFVEDGLARALLEAA